MSTPVAGGGGDPAFDAATSVAAKAGRCEGRLYMFKHEPGSPGMSRRRRLAQSVSGVVAAVVEVVPTAALIPVAAAAGGVRSVSCGCPARRSAQ